MVGRKRAVKRDEIIIFGDSPRKDHLRGKAREKMIRQGAVSEASTSFSSSFIVPFAKAIGANAAHIGFLSAFSGLIAPLGNLWGSKLMEKRSRKQIHITYTWLQSLVWLPIILLVFFYAKSIGLVYLPVALIILYSLFIFLSAVKDPPSFSWVGDLVPEKERGHYFARRNRVIGWWGVAIFLLGGIILYWFEQKPYVLAIYSAVFFASIILRIISLYQIKRVFSHHFILHKSSHFSFWSFLRRYD